MLFASTGARGVEWQDPGVHQFRILTGLAEHPLGLALSHPLHYWLGRALIHLPLDPLWTLNLMSGLCGAIGVGLLGGLVVTLTRRPLAAILAAAALALSHAYWQMSALTETYTLAAALMTAEWLLLFRYLRSRQPLWLVAVLAINGLHVADHLLGLLTLITYGVLLLIHVAGRKIRLAWLPVATAAWLATAAPYWSLAVQHYQRTGDLPETLHSAFFGGNAARPGFSGEVLNLRVTAGQLSVAGLTLAYCFPSFAGIVALAGLLRRRRGPRRLFGRVLIAQTLIIFVFVARYTIADLYTYFVPVCALTALWVGLGVPPVLRWGRGPRHRSRRAQDSSPSQGEGRVGVESPETPTLPQPLPTAETPLGSRSTAGHLRRWAVRVVLASTFLTPAVYWAFPLVAQQRGWLSTRLRHIPYRNEYHHFFRPWRFLDDSPQRFAHAALAQAGPESWIIANSTTAFPIAVIWLTQPHPTDQRVYSARRCLTHPDQPDLTDEELYHRVASGHPVYALWMAEVKDVVRGPLVTEPGDPLSRVQVKRPSG